MSTEAELVDRVLHLPAGDRASLAKKIILSLEPAEFDADSQAAWDAEIELRLGKLDRGEVTPLDWRKSINHARASIKRTDAK